MASDLQFIANPQGKGVISVLDDLHTSKPTNVQSKNTHQWLADYFTSMLVLSAKFKFKPIIGKNYYLYIKNNQLNLSLVEPNEWKSDKSGAYFAECMLHQDMSWSIKPKRGWQKDITLFNTIQNYQISFLRKMNDEIPIVEQLPFFIQQFSYYQRLGANALARSLKQSLEIKIGKNESVMLSGKSILKDIKDNTMHDEKKLLNILHH